MNNPTAAVQNTNKLLDLYLKNIGRFFDCLLLLLLHFTIVHAAGVITDLALFAIENCILY